MDPKCFILAVLAREGENPEVLHKTKDGWVSYMSRGMKARDPRSGRPKKNKKEAINNEELFQPLGFCMFLCFVVVLVGCFFEQEGRIR